jgi:CheY-like chemotaxis protein
MREKSGAVLVVDDSDDLVRLLQVVLSGAGYRVVPASSGEEAVQVLQRDSQAIQMALVDVRMPGMDGPTTVRRLLALRPDLPCVLMTGYAGSCTTKTLEESGARAILAKPFQLEEVVFMVQALMNHRSCFGSPATYAGELLLPTDRPEPSERLQ